MQYLGPARLARLILFSPRSAHGSSNERKKSRQAPAITKPVESASRRARLAESMVSEPILQVGPAREGGPRAERLVDGVAVVVLHHVLLIRDGTHGGPYTPVLGDLPPGSEEDRNAATAENRSFNP